MLLNDYDKCLIFDLFLKYFLLDCVIDLMYVWYVVVVKDNLIYNCNVGFCYF